LRRVEWDKETIRTQDIAMECQILLLLLVNPSYPQVDTLPYWLSFCTCAHYIAASQVYDNNVLVMCRVEASRRCELAISLREDRASPISKTIYSAMLQRML
jgi:hypothetical protein